MRTNCLYVFLLFTLAESSQEDTAFAGMPAIYATHAGGGAFSQFNWNGTETSKISTVDHFPYPSGIAVDSAGTLYVGNQSGGLYRYASDGTYLGVFQDQNQAAPMSLVIDHEGNLIVAYFNSRIAKYSLSGQSLWSFQYVDLGMFFTGIAVDSSDNVFAVAQGDTRVVKFATNGDYLGNAIQMQSPILASNIAIDSNNNIYVTNSQWPQVSVVEKYSSTGDWLTSLPIAGSNEASPFAIAFEPSVGLLVGMMWNNYTNQPGYIAKYNEASGVFEAFTNRLISPVYGPMGIAIAPAFPDYGNDGMVGAEDYVLWRRTIGATVSPYSGADGNGNGTVDQADYDIWRSRFGNAPSPPPLGSATNVPEPWIPALISWVFAALFSRKTFNNSARRLRKYIGTRSVGLAKRLV